MELNHPRQLVLAGFMGSGKTVVGKALAALLRRRFVDVDVEIEVDAGLAIPEIFAREGEARFREREARAIADLAALADAVLAVGGGAIVAPENRARLYRIGPVICLEAPPSLLWSRVAGGDRPLAPDRASFMALHDRRKAAYRDLPYHVATRGQTPEGIAARIARSFVGQEARVRVPLEDRGYEVAVLPGALCDLGARVARVLPPGPCLLLTHPAVARRHGEVALASLRAAGWRPQLALVPPGEPTKSLSHAMRLYDQLAAARLARRDPVIALGGGVVGDLAGFVAATYLRGVPLVQVPTTLLAQIDSSVGGKVAVNLARGKNLVGAFHQPSLVVADPLVLHTLSEREYRAGLAELVKYGVILDEGLFGRMERDLAAILAREPAVLVPLIARACELKAEVVARDEREGGPRRILNFGHTIGHAVEAVAGYGKVLHGEAVAIGMVAAARLGERVGACEGPGVSARIAALLAGAGLPVATDLPPRDLLEAMRQDKKVVDGAIAWVLPAAIGRVEIRAGVSDEDVRAAIQAPMLS